VDSFWWLGRPREIERVIIVQTDEELISDPDFNVVFVIEVSGYTVGIKIGERD